MILGVLPWVWCFRERCRSACPVAAFRVAPPAVRRQVLEGEADRVHEPVATGAGSTVAVPGHLLAQRRHAIRPVVRRVLQCGHVGRRFRRGSAEHVFQDPHTPLDRRGPVVLHPGDRQEAALAQQPAAAVEVRAEPPAAEMRAVDVRDAVVLRQSLVQERVVGGHQVDDVAVLAEHALEQQLGLARERLAQLVVPVGEDGLGGGGRTATARRSS